jgi:hypothetical protein
VHTDRAPSLASSFARIAMGAIPAATKLPTTCSISGTPATGTKIFGIA